MHDMPTGSVTTPQLATTAAAARVASCGRATVWRAIQRGELEAIRLGRHGDYRIPAEALDAWLQPATPNEGARA
ncbi:hypothetical protein BH09ACT13_BH09ACT13_11960 [soil metagenome]